MLHFSRRLFCAAFLSGQVLLSQSSYLLVNAQGVEVPTTIETAIAPPIIETSAPTVSPTLSATVIESVIPQDSHVIVDFATQPTFHFEGDFTNNGTIYAISTNPTVQTGTISAQNIVNAQGATITTVLPSTGLPGITNALANFNLILNAVQNLTNAGTISSSGNLTMTAGNVIQNIGAITSGGNLTATAGTQIINSLPAGVAGTAPVMQALNNVNLTAPNVTNIGSIVSQLANVNLVNNVLNNSGAVEALMGSANISTLSSNALSVTNTLGAITARDSANFSTTPQLETGVTGRAALALVDGAVTANKINFGSPNGDVKVNAENLNGPVAISACNAEIHSRNGDLTISELNLTADPVFTSGGNLEFTGTVFTGGLTTLATGGDQFVALAAGNVTSSTTGSVDASSITTIGGPIRIGAGVTWNGSNEITGASASGGNVSLPNVSFTTNGAPIEVQAKSGSTAGSGNVNIGPLSSAGTSASGGNSGPIFVSASKSITTSSLNSSLGSGGTSGGKVQLLAGGGSATVNGNINSGAYVNIDTPNTMLTGTTPNKINVTGSITVAGQMAILRAGNNIATGSINVDGVSGGNPGGVDIQANLGATSTTATTQFVTGSTGQTNGVNGTISATTTGTGNNGNHLIRITNKGTGGIRLVSGSDFSVGVTNGKAGVIALDCPDGTMILPAGTLSADGATGQAAGKIALSAKTINANGTTITASDSGSGTDHHVAISAETINLGAGLTVNADGDGDANGFAAVYFLPKGTVQISTTWIPPNDILLEALVLQSTPLTFNGSGALNVSANGADRTVKFMGYPLNFAVGSGAVTINANGSNTKVEITAQQGATTGAGLQVRGGNITINANGTNNSSGGTVKITADRLANPSGSWPTVTINANGDGTGNGGTIDLQLDKSSVLWIGNLGGDYNFSATSGSSGGNGGTIIVNNVDTAGSSAINIENAAAGASHPINVDAQGAIGNGGIIKLDAGAIHFTQPNHVLSANGQGTGSGGLIHLRQYLSVADPLIIGTALSTSAQNGVMLSATGGNSGNGGTIEVLAPNNSIAADASALTVAAGTSGTGGNGGTIILSAGHTLTLAGSFIATGHGSGNGGQINASGFTVNMGLGSMSVDGGSNGGNGGSITMSSVGPGTFSVRSVALIAANPNPSATPSESATTSTSSANVLDGLNARGGSSGSAAGNGGTINLQSGGNLAVETSAFSVRPLGSNGNGGAISLVAGTNVAGTISVQGDLSARGVGTGNGGNIEVKYSSPSNLPSTIQFIGTTQVDASAAATGEGGAISFENTAGNLTLNLPDLVASRSQGVSSSLGLISFKGADIVVESAGKVDGLVNTTSTNNTTFQIIDSDGTGLLIVGQVSAQGSVTLKAPKVSLPTSQSSVNANGLPGPSGTNGHLTIATTNLLNNGTIKLNAANGLLNLQDNRQVSFDMNISGNGRFESSNTGGIVVSNFSSVNGILTISGQQRFEYGDLGLKILQAGPDGQPGGDPNITGSPGSIRFTGATITLFGLQRAALNSPKITIDAGSTITATNLGFQAFQLVNAGTVASTGLVLQTSPTQDLTISGGGTLRGNFEVLSGNEKIVNGQQVFAAGAGLAITDQTVTSGGIVKVSNRVLVIGTSSTLEASGAMELFVHRVTNDNILRAADGTMTINSGAVGPISEDLRISGSGHLDATSSGTITVSNTREVHIAQNQITGALRVSSVGPTEISTSSGALKIGNITANGGSVSVTANGPSLTLEDNTAINAMLTGNIILQNLNASGTISTGNGSTLSAAGNVFLFLGATPTAPYIKGTKPSNVTVNGDPTEAHEFYGSGITSLGSNVINVGTLAGNVVFSGGTGITINNLTVNLTGANPLANPFQPIAFPAISTPLIQAQDFEDAAFIFDATSNIVDAGDCYRLRNGQVFVHAKRPTVLDVGGVIIQLRRKSMVLVQSVEGAVIIYALSEQGAGDIAVIAPLRCALISGESLAISTEQIPSLVPNRHSWTTKIGEKTITKAEVPLVGLVDKSAVLQYMTNTDAFETQVDVIMKTAAALHLVTGGHGAFRR